MLVREPRQSCRRGACSLGATHSRRERTACKSTSSLFMNETQTAAADRQQQLGTNSQKRQPRWRRKHTTVLFFSHSDGIHTSRPCDADTIVSAAAHTPALARGVSGSDDTHSSLASSLLEILASTASIPRVFSVLGEPKSASTVLHTVDVAKIAGPAPSSASTAIATHPSRRTQCKSHRRQLKSTKTIQSFDWP
jgi:hypothetical protein